MEGQKTELKIIRMSEVESQEVKWLWYPFIPYGKLTIIQGDPGDGKTTLVLNIAAKLSKGECLDSDMDVQEPVNVIYQTAEDGLADTVKPRLELAGADCEKILVIDESDKSLSMADERLEEALAKTGAKVLILDPIQAYLGGGMDMNRANEARDMTKKLGALAEKYQCAILLIGHMNKASGNKAAYRGMGSIDFFAVARSVLLVGRIEGEPNTRAVVQIKNNLAAFGVEKTEEGCSLIARNAEKFGLNNIEIIHGNASDVIDNLPVPDEVFIGGSGGESEYIFDSILRKNPNVHVVATAVTLETLQDMISLMEKNNMSVIDTVQIAVTQIKKTGRYHMMSANNPVFIIEGRRMQ